MPPAVHEPSPIHPPTYRARSLTERGKDSFFEELIRTYVLLGFRSAERGKPIVACGTGKTFTSLRLASPFSS